MIRNSKNPGQEGNLTYAQAGIDRGVREKSQLGIQATLAESARQYKYGKPIQLPFGRIFPISGSSPFYYDQQIEGVGTKTLLAELAGKYDTIGIDAVAMAVNDVLRSGAEPFLLSDALHITNSNPIIVDSILQGVRKGTQLANCTLASGETGDVGEILHAPISPGGLPFDLFASCLGIAEKNQVIEGNIAEADQIIGFESSGIHSNGLTLARKVLLKKWGGIYDPSDQPGNLHRTVISELLEPTRIYVQAIQTLKKENVKIKAAIHITGDGLAKFRRLLQFQRKSKLGLRLELRNAAPPVFTLIMDAAKQTGSPISPAEMFRTFNMGIGFAIILSPKDSIRAIDSINNECGAKIIGTITNDGKIGVQSTFSNKIVWL